MTTETREPASKQPEHDPDAAVRELVETAAKAYFSTCRRLAKAISRLKSKA